MVAQFSTGILAHFSISIYSSWQILHADQALRELYMLLHAESTPDWEAIHHYVEDVLKTGTAIIQRAKEERRKYENG